MLRFEDQSLTEEQKGGNPRSSAGAGACEREITASVLGGFSLRGVGNIRLQITCWAGGVSHLLHREWHRVTRVTGANPLLLGGFSQLPQAWGFRLLIPHLWGGGGRNGLVSDSWNKGEVGLILSSSFQERDTARAHLFEERTLLSTQPTSCPGWRRSGHGLGAIHFLQTCLEIVLKAPPAASSAFSQWEPLQTRPVQGGEGGWNSKKSLLPQSFPK